jgi:hypothetical protein
LNEDFQDLLAALLDSGARFLVVGAHALAVHGVPRATGDLDIWIPLNHENTDLVWRALKHFGAPLESLGVSRGDLNTVGMVVQIGLPPRRIDILTDLSGVDFESAWSSRVEHVVGSVKVPFIGRETLLKNKRATGRTKDLADVEALEGGE